MKTLAFALALVVTIVGSIPAQAQSQFGQQGPKLVGTGASGNAAQGFSVSLSGDGNTAIVGGPADCGKRPVQACGFGAAWIFTRLAGVWSQQGGKLGEGGPYPAEFPARIGSSVSLSGDGNTAIVGGPDAHRGRGAASVSSAAVQLAKKIFGGLGGNSLNLRNIFSTPAG